jgi:hypothetical protein
LEKSSPPYPKLTGIPSLKNFIKEINPIPKFLGQPNNVENIGTVSLILKFKKDLGIQNKIVN